MFSCSIVQTIPTLNLIFISTLIFTHYSVIQLKRTIVPLLTRALLYKLALPTLVTIILLIINNLPVMVNGIIQTHSSNNNKKKTSCLHIYTNTTLSLIGMFMFAVTKGTGLPWEWRKTYGNRCSSTWSPVITIRHTLMISDWPLSSKHSTVLVNLYRTDGTSSGI